jgi:cytochrome d ubiquinol oxidase subunit II
MNTIGPVWDGNEVWLVTGGGALFAAFPLVYATVFSGFYLAFILFLFALILRATALEFRNKEDFIFWKKFWDGAFALGSILATFLLGVAFGNIVRGIPLGLDMEFTGTFLSLLNPFSLFFGLAALMVLAFHGSVYLAVKTEKGLYQHMVTIAQKGSIVLPLVLLILFFYALWDSSLLCQTLGERPYLSVAAFGAALSCFGVRAGLKENPFMALLFSSASIILALVFFLAGLYPNCVYCPIHPSLSLTIRNASSSPLTLQVMAILALFTLPLILFYTFWVYRVFKGKVRPENNGY